MIRLLEKKDIPAVYDIYSWYVLYSDAIFDLEVLPFADFERKMLDLIETCPIYTAWHDEELIGYAYYHPAFSKDAYRYDVELTIYFRQGPHYGLAQKLYETLEETAWRQNIRWIISCITDSNEQSIAFHERNGFLRSGSLKDSGLKNGKWLGVCWYVKALHSSREYLEKDLEFIPFSKLVR